jgi:DNA-3-methyladenine glycosylase
VHDCFNVVTGPRGVGEAVLVRALEPLLGLEAMCVRRGVEHPRDLCRGPGRLAQALGIGAQDDARSLLRGSLGIWSDGARPRRADILTTPRVGISSARELPLRFVLRGSRFASRRS